MTVVYVDDHLIDGRSLVNGTIEEAVRHAQTNHCAADRLVVSLKCDGQDVSPAQMELTLRRRAGDVQRLEIVTGSRRELIGEVLTQASLSLEQTVTACQQAGELIVQGKIAEGIEELGKCTREWQQIHQAIFQSISILGPDAWNLTVGDRSLNDLMEDPHNALLQVKNALLAQDHVLLADVLQYEFTDALEIWRVLVNKLLEMARAM